jgi:hypothetical protein
LLQALWVIESVQYNCKLYDYDISLPLLPVTQHPLTETTTYNVAGDYVAGDKIQRDKIISSQVNIDKLGILNAGTVHTQKQIGFQQPEDLQ